MKDEDIIDKLIDGVLVDAPPSVMEDPLIYPIPIEWAGEVLTFPKNSTWIGQIEPNNPDAEIDLLIDLSIPKETGTIFTITIKTEDDE